MRLWLILFLFSTGGLAFSAAPPFCYNLEGTGLKESTVREFFGHLKIALKKEDYKALSRMLHYPISVVLSEKKVIKPGQGIKIVRPVFVPLSEKKIILKDKKSFLTMAPKIFTPAYRKKILQSEPKDRICRSDGIGLSHGSLWIAAPQYHQNKDALKVIAINKVTLK